MEGQLRLLSTADSSKRYFVALSPAVGETGIYSNPAQACSLTNTTLKSIVGYLEAVATLQNMMAGESRTGNSGTSTPPPTSPDARVGEHSIRSLLGQREREQEIAHRMYNVSQVMGALELLDPNVGNPQLHETNTQILASEAQRGVSIRTRNSLQRSLSIPS